MFDNSRKQFEGKNGEMRKKEIAVGKNPGHMVHTTLLQISPEATFQILTSGPSTPYTGSSSGIPTLAISVLSSPSGSSPLQ
jgi:hypothetical protein